VLCWEPSSSGPRSFEIEFDFLVLATGSSYSMPIRPQVPGLPLGAHLSASPRVSGVSGAFSLPSEAGVGPSMQQRLQELESSARSLAAAQSVAVVGGGTVGVELAAEIAGRFGAAKRVTLFIRNNK
jgi:NADH dehydrogenase FAD-containing subunit